MRISNQSFRRVVMAATLSTLCNFPALADDTEVFFGADALAGGGGVRPNVLFVLDTSSSMSQIVDGTGKSRLDNMKEALRTILSSASNINVGLMRFSSPGGPVLFPVNNIDQDICELESCDVIAPEAQSRIGSGEDDAEEAADGQVRLDSEVLQLVEDAALSGSETQTVEVSIAAENDDVEEDVDGDVYRDSSDLEVLYDAYNSHGTQKIGLRFQDVAVPQGATITSATLVFTVDEDGSGSISVDIIGHKVDDSGAFNASDDQVSDRLSAAPTIAQVNWDDIPDSGVGSEVTSPSIAEIVQEIVNQSDWASGNAMTFFLVKDPASTSDSSNKRVFEAYGSGSKRPKLVIQYASGEGLDDTTQTVGLRFRDVQVPQGVTVTSARLEFDVAEASTGSAALTIHGEDVDNSTAFSDADNDLSGRTATSASASWAPEEWPTVDEKKQSVDISAIVNEIVQRSGWCGGNSLAVLISGTGRRSAQAFESTSGDAPLLKISYDPDSIPVGGGCINQTILKRVGDGNDDAEEDTSSHGVSVTSSDLELPRDDHDQIVGVRFQDLNIPRGATILEASLSFEVDRQRSGSVSLRIRGEDVDNAAAFTSSSSNISNRTTTSAAVSWSSVPQEPENSVITSPDIASIIQEIVNREGWSSGNDLALLLERSGGGTDTLEVESFNGEAAAAPLLRVKLQWTNDGSDEATTVTVRDRLIQVVDNLAYRSSTPIVDTLYEAALYYRENVLYGLQRGAESQSRREYTRVSHPLSYTGGTVVREAGCTDANLNATDCRSENITGSPTYVSPIADSCQTNFIVLLSDGAPTYNESTDEVHAMAGIGSCADSGAAACGPELTKYLYENDQSDLDQTQNIITYTIGFNFSGDYLRSLATQGGGSFYEATTAADLTNAFGTIITEIQAVDTSFVAPGATVNQFNRLSHRDELYFALFRPNERPKWDGNVKRYRVTGDPAVIKDANDLEAVDDGTGFFKDSAQSYWSASADGADVALGGAASKLPTTRKLYTQTGSNASLSAAENALSESNTAITKEMLGIEGAEDSYRTSLLQWARGVDLKDYDEDSNTSEIRLQLGDPLHSRPVIVTYGGTDDSPDTTVFFGTNEGFVHAVNGSTGIEQFGFIPKELLPNLNDFYVDAIATTHPYGMDGQISVWYNDADGDNQITADTNDFVYLYAGMRRGGRSYYALDVTDRSAPRLLWSITGGSGDFTELGQTWGLPVVTAVQIDDTVRKVVIFPGGYDEDQDSYTVRTADSQGRAIFMVDAADGSLVWSGGPDNTHTERYTDMRYSIPGNVRVVDINGDGLADQMYVGDMGGQLWRFDIQNGATNANQLVSGGVIADLAGDTEADNRRFFGEPDVALVGRAGEQYLAISIGSGWRSHPLDTAVADRFYSLRSPDIFTAPDAYSALFESDFYDATSNLIGQGTNDQSVAAQAVLDGKSGWYIRLTRAGEKVVSESLTVNNQVVFTTYHPSAAISACSAALGLGRVYVMSIFDATPTLNLDGIGTIENLVISDRERTLDHGGIPPEPAILFPPGSDPIILVGPEQPVSELRVQELTQRTFWRESAE